MYHTSHAERLREQSSSSQPDKSSANHQRQAFHKARSSMGAAGHWIRTAGLLAPLVIGEFVKDPDKRWRWIRIASVATTLISEGMYTNHVRSERERTRELEAQLGC